MGYSIYICKGDETLKMPTNPEQVEWTNGQRVSEYEIVKLGLVSLPETMELRTYAFSVEIPYSSRGYGESGVVYDSAYYLNTLRAWRESKEPLRLVISSDINKFSELVLITDMDVKEVSGEEGDYYVSFKFTEYRPFGLKEVFLEGVGGSPPPSQPTTPRQSNPPKPTSGVYTVSSGDTLWSLAKRFLGSGSRYTEIHQANKSTIGSNPNLIKPGMKLVIPNGG